jgi:hypothetical protein
VGEHRIALLDHGLEASQCRLPGLGQPGCFCGDAVDGFGRVVLAGQQERHLGEHAALAHRKQDRPHLDALALSRGECGGFGVDDQQGLWAHLRSAGAGARAGGQRWQLNGAFGCWLALASCRHRLRGAQQP